jgi:hypothetical protein
MSIAKKVLAEYKVGKTVGEGAFSKVKLGIHKATGEKVRRWADFVSHLHRMQFGDS